MKLCSYTVLRLLVVVVIISSLLVPSGYCQETEDSQIFISGFNAYQQKNYPVAIEKMTSVLARYPDTPLRDMALFWLSRAFFKNGNQRDAARYMSQFSKEYPDNPLRSTVDEDLLALTARYDKGETLPAGTLPAALVDRPVVAQKVGTDQERLAKEQAEKEKLARQQDEQKRLAAVKAEQERVAEATRLADLKAEQDRKATDQTKVTTQKAEQDRAAAAEAARVAAAQKEQERLAAVTAEEQRAVETARLAEITAEQKRKTAEQAAARKAEDERLAAARAEEKRAIAAEAARVAAVQKEQERLATSKTEEQRVAEAARAAEAKAGQERKTAEQARIAARKAEEDRLAADKAEKLRVAEAARLAEVKAEQDRKAAEESRIAVQKAEKDRLAAEEADMTLVAKQQAELVRLSMAKAELKASKTREAQAAAGAVESAKVAALKAEAKRKNDEAVEQARLAAIKAEEDRIAREQTSVSQKDVDEAEQKKLATLKAEQERSSATQADQRRADREKSERERAAKLQRDQAQQKAEQERAASERVEKERVASDAAEVERLVSVKREQDRIAAEKAAATAAETARLAASQKEKDRATETRVSEKKPTRQREGQETSRTAKSALREKAIAQYKSIIEKYPKSASATAAAAKLKELGVSVAMPQQSIISELQPENAKVLNLEVAQFAGVEINLPDQPQAYPVARRLSIPFELVNRGNGTDSFYLESGFPNEFASSFAAQSSPDTSINLTPSMAPGESFKGVISLLMPASSIDGRRVNYPFKAASRLLPEATQSRTVAMTASAPLVRAVIKSDKSQPLPGEKVIYRVAILNVGSAAAQDVSFRLNFPPQMEPVDYAASGFRQEMKAALVIDGLQIKSGESREFSLAFQLKEDSMAGQELVARAELTNNLLKTNATFVSNASYVKQQRGIQVRPASERLVVIPGQTINVPFVVTNTGNGRERLTIASSLKGAQDVVIFHDLNRDGIRQASEPLITEIGPLAPKEEASVVMEIKTPRTATDGSDGLAQISFSSDVDAARTFTGSTRLAYSRPVLDMVMTGGGSGRLKPGEVASFDLTITNRGSNLARVVDLQSAWPDKLELVAADPANNSAANGAILWKFKELGAGEKRTIKVSFRVKPGTSMGTNIQVKNILSYEDQLGNRY